MVKKSELGYLVIKAHQYPFGWLKPEVSMEYFSTIAAATRNWEKQKSGLRKSDIDTGVYLCKVLKYTL